MTLARIIALAGAFCMANLPAHAEAIVFANVIGNISGGMGITGSSFGSGSVATAFIPTAEFLLTGAKVEVFQVFEPGVDGDGLFDASLYSNSLVSCGVRGTCDIPGSLIATLGTGIEAPGGGGLVTISNLPEQLLLSAGTEYWLVLSPFDSTTNVSWEIAGSTPDVASAILASGRWTNIGPNELQFEIDGASKPEPGTLALVGTAAVLAGAILRRTRRGAKAGVS